MYIFSAIKSACFFNLVGKFCQFQASASSEKSTRDVWVETSCNTVAAFPAGPKKVKEDQIQHSSSVQIGAIW